MRLALLLLPVWVMGAGELARFASNNVPAGMFEANGFVKGRDFVQFYVAGTLAREGEWRDLYEVSALEQQVARIVPAAAGQVPAPVYGPHVALLFVPLSRLSYITARWWWFAVSAAAYLLAGALILWSVAPLYDFRLLAWVTLLCNPALGVLLSTGQTGGFAALAWALAAASLSRKRVMLAGVWLGLLSVKPTLLIGVLPPLLITRQWGMLGGVLLSSCGLVTLTLLSVGAEPWTYYLGVVQAASSLYYLTDTIPHQKQSLLGFFQLLGGPSTSVVVLTGLASAAVLALWWRQRRHISALELIPKLAVTSVLLSPHFYVYDLVVLTPGLLVLAERLSRRQTTCRVLAVAAYLLLFAPFFGAVALHTGIQPSAILLFVALAAMRPMEVRQ